MPSGERRRPGPTGDNLARFTRIVSEHPDLLPKILSAVVQLELEGRIDEPDEVLMPEILERIGLQAVATPHSHNTDNRITTSR